MVQVNKIGDQLQAAGDKVASLEGHLWGAAADLDSLLSENQGLGFPLEIQWIPLDFRQRSGFWWKFQRVTFASFPLEQVGAVPKGVPVSGGISGGIPLDWSSTGTGAQTLAKIASHTSGRLVSL